MPGWKCNQPHALHAAGFYFCLTNLASQISDNGDAIRASRKVALQAYFFFDGHAR
jgi:hypothetical protein